MSFFSVRSFLYALILICVSVGLRGYIYSPYIKHIKNSKNSTVAGIDAVYLINLAKSTGRHKRSREILTNHSVGFDRFEAVNGWELSRCEKVQLCKNNNLRYLRPGEVGVFLSHLSIANSVVEHEVKTAWVLEDDFKIVGDISEISKAILELDILDPDWDVLYTDVTMKWKDGINFFPNMSRLHNLYGIQFMKDYGISERFRTKKVSDTLSRVYIRYGLTSFVFSLKGAKKFAQYFSKNLLVWPIDLQIHFIPGLRQYVMSREVVTNDVALFYNSNTKKNLSGDD